MTDYSLQNDSTLNLSVQERLDLIQRALEIAADFVQRLDEAKWVVTGDLQNSFNVATFNYAVALLQAGRLAKGSNEQEFLEHFGETDRELSQFLGSVNTSFKNAVIEAVDKSPLFDKAEIPEWYQNRIKTHLTRKRSFAGLGV